MREKIEDNTYVSLQKTHPTSEYDIINQRDEYYSNSSVKAQIKCLNFYNTFQYFIQYSAILKILSNLLYSNVLVFTGIVRC